MRSHDRSADSWPRRFRALYGVWTFTVLLGLGTQLAAQAADTSAPLAQVNGQAITAHEVDRALGAPLRKLEEQIYQMKRQKIDALIDNRLLAAEAAKREISVPALLDAEVTAKVGLVTEGEIETVYQANKAQLRGEEATVREQLRAQLQKQKLAARRAAFLDSLRSQASVVVNLQAPPVFQAEVATEGAPFLGPAAAPVTIVEFSDFHCPFCKQVLPTLSQLLSRYPDQVKLVFRQFPIQSLHPQAPKAAEAARCAHDQGKFWEYHDALFAAAPRASVEELNTYAQQVGLDLPQFEGCLSGGIHQAAVQADLEDGMRLGVNGTPAFFINGRFIAGAQPLESFVSLIDAEIARAKVAQPAGQEGTK